MTAEQEQREYAAFEAFEAYRWHDRSHEPGVGFFDGFAMCETFHAAYPKSKALAWLVSDDSGDVRLSGEDIHVGADGVTVYFMTVDSLKGEHERLVRFNRSVYLF